jgi:hypothetical protein
MVMLKPGGPRAGVFAPPSSRSPTRPRHPGQDAAEVPFSNHVIKALRRDIWGSSCKMLQELLGI